ncbi:uncharacterized protein CLAFUR5_05840 [Fulvia fulva]|uniref:Uncharacterized protein n=1 Tax=Passalora fulva TaxID=5499 RepID=A0A9Q8LHK5_PASFU|nr:uncharacterized protein CLAFUR5_05840 [Fulvia fulva]KAK4625562.1 hypothetical protein CLAFUR0_05702 [Fulvia fulva]UJO17615.1 hypothetical protein CLAFUR5_05840 [Fulvia fulva]
MPLLLLFSIFTFILSTFATNNNTTATSNPTRTISISAGFSARVPVSLVSAPICGPTTLAVDICDVQICTTVNGTRFPSGLAHVTLSTSLYHLHFDLIATSDTATWTISGSSTCSLHGVPSTITSKVCTGRVSAWIPDVTTVSYAANATTTTDLEKLGMGQVLVTGGLEKLPAPSASCVTGATASGTSSGMALGSAVVEVVKVLMPAGAVGIVGAGLLL